MKVHEALGWTEPVIGDVGIEIEVEAKDRLPNVPRDVSAMWTSKADNSLRFIGREYVTNGAQKLDQPLQSSLTTLCDVINKAEVIHNSPRTSVHVHVNVSNMSLSGVWTGITSFWLIENLLVDFCGENRVSNLFCFRLKDTEGLLKYVDRDLKSSTPFVRHLAGDQVRYAALNLNAIAKFGSVESRSMRGITNPVEIYEWAQLIHNIIHKTALTFSTPSNLLDAYFKTSREDFLNTIVGDTWSKKLIKHCGKSWDDMIEDNVGSVLQVAYSHDWDKWESRIEAPKKRARARVNIDNPFDQPLIQPVIDWADAPIQRIRGRDDDVLIALDQEGVNRPMDWQQVIERAQVQVAVGGGNLPPQVQAVDDDF